MIGDFKGGDETAVAQALEAFDILGNAMTEYKTAVKGESAAAPASQAATMQPHAASNPFQVICVQQAYLIVFDMSPESRVACRLSLTP